MKNKTLNLFMLVSLFPLALFANGNMKKNSKVILSGNILANSQVVPVGGQAKTVMAAGSGKIRMSSTRYCGDGDVADYHDKHPTTEFYDVHDEDTNIVVGYWLLPQGSTDFAANKFFSLGYVKNSKIDSDVTEKIIPTNFSSQPPKQTFELIKDAVKDIAFIAENTKAASVQGLSNTKFDMKFVAMACPKIKNDHGVDSNSGLNNLKITRQFLTGNTLVGNTNLKDYMNDGILEGNGSISKTRVKVDGAGASNLAKSVDLDFGGSGDSLSGSLTGLVNDLASASKPPHVGPTSVSVTLPTSPVTTLTCDCEALKYDDSLSSLKSRLNDVVNKINQARANKSNCDAGLASFDSADYPWESFRTNAACQMYHKMIAEEGSSLESAIANLFTADLNKSSCAAVQAAASSGSCPGSGVSKVPNLTDSEFRDRKIAIAKKLMKIVGTPNAIQVAQNSLKTKVETNNPNSVLNTASCFPLTAGSGEFIKYISSSVGIHIAADPAAAGSKIMSIDPAPVTHPEGNFAIGGDAPYLTGDGNKLILFNNTAGDAKMTDGAFKVEVGMSSAVTLTTGVANVQFHIRSVGCTQNIYCLNGR